MHSRKNEAHFKTIDLREEKAGIELFSSYLPYFYFIIFQEIGFSVVEMNASDTRSKSCLQSEVMTLLQNSSLVDFCGK